MSIFSTAPFMGPALGPVIGGFLGETAGWRWVMGFMAAFSGLLWIIGTLLVPETYAPVLLRNGPRSCQRLPAKSTDQSLILSVVRSQSLKPSKLHCLGHGSCSSASRLYSSSV